MWLQWAADHGVRYDDTGKSFAEVARDYYQTSDSYRELVYPDLGDDALTASHRAAANVANARTLLIEAVIGRRGGDLDPYVNPLEVIDPNGRGVPAPPTSRFRHPVGIDRWPGRDPGATAGTPRRGHRPGVPAVTQPQLPLPDVPLLIEAKRLADAGAAPEEIEELLDQGRAVARRARLMAGYRRPVTAS